jgi:PhnB protein
MLKSDEHGYLKTTLKKSLYLGGNRMASINPYLTFSGQAEAAFLFYQTVFGGSFSYFQRFRDMPGANQLEDQEKEKIMHISLPIGDTILMGSDTLSSMGQPITIGNHFSIHLSPNSKDDADRFFSALSNGGQILMPLEDTFWNTYFGMVIDKFGIKWMINYEPKV